MTSTNTQDNYSTTQTEQSAYVVAALLADLQVAVAVQLRHAVCISETRREDKDSPAGTPLRRCRPSVFWLIRYCNTKMIPRKQTVQHKPSSKLNEHNQNANYCSSKTHSKHKYLEDAAVDQLDDGHVGLGRHGFERRHHRALLLRLLHRRRRLQHDA